MRPDNMYSKFVWNICRCRFTMERSHVQFFKARTVCFRTRQVTYTWGFVGQVTRNQTV